jgi:hypothetical protein
MEDSAERRVVRAEVRSPNLEVRRVWLHDSQRSIDDPPLAIGLLVVVEDEEGRGWPGTVTGYANLNWEITLDS